MALTWLHLSDLHACNPKHGWDAARVTRTLVDDLNLLQQKHGLRPDLIFFTGDAAFGNLGKDGGKSLREQFDEFAAFMDQVRAAFEPAVLKSNVFIVPGNHDVDRDEVTESQTQWLASHRSAEPVLQLIHGGKAEWRRYMERLKDYRAFLQRHGLDHLLADPERLVYSQTRSVDGIAVGIAGFNSAWSCGRDREKGQLWLGGRWQYGVLTGQLPVADFRIALMHHPPDWLSEHENPTFGRMLQQDFRFLLHGHEHQPWMQTTDDGYVVASAAACYQRADQENGYNLVRLDPGQGSGEAWLRTFDDATGKWGPRSMPERTDERGVQRLNLPWLGQSLVEAEAPRAVDPLAVVAGVRALAAAEEDPWQAELERYLRKLRAAHRELPVIGYETQVHLPILLDEVYIPLTARFDRHMQPGRDEEAGTVRALPESEATERRVPFDGVLSLAKEQGYSGVVVIGDPGSGKTTLLRHFVLAATDAALGPAMLGLPAATVPVLVELRRLQDPAAGLKAALEETVARVDPALDAATFSRELLRRQPLLILIDGLDEVADEAQRAKVSRWVEEAVRQQEESRFVVTCRYAGYRGDAQLQQRFLRFDVEELEEEQARRFIGAWYRAVEYEDLRRKEPTEAEDSVREKAEREAAEAAAKLEADVFVEAGDPRLQRLRDLVRNPLMLQILCLVHHNGKQLPKRRVELYRECLVVLLELWRNAIGLKMEISAREAQQLLQPVAWWLQVSQRRDALFADMAAHMAAPLRHLGRDPQDAARLLATFRDRSGVLVSLGQGAHSFLHLSLQEYLAACHVQNHPELLEELARHFGNSWWREVTLLVVALDNPSRFEPLMAALIRSHALQRDAQLADDCLRDALLKTPQPMLAALAHGLGNEAERYAALRLLRHLPDWKEELLPPPSGLLGRLRSWLGNPPACTGAELLERLSRRAKNLQIRRLARELLGGWSRVAGEPEVGDERTHERSGMVLVYVPGGEYVMGADDLIHPYTQEIYEASKPEHKVQLSPYWIGKYPVTNAQYSRFLAASPRQKKPENWEDKQFNQGEQPVVGVDWEEAQAFCAWAGLVLPSEAQWEAAARGWEGRKYPWGEAEPTAELANFNGNVGRTTPVDAYPAGAGPFGTLDQAGNVWEWCLDVWNAAAYRGRHREATKDPVSKQGDAASRVVRGGSWRNPARFLQAAYRSGFRTGDRYPYLGFRCASPFRPEL